MKSLKQLIFPVAVLLLGTGAALATNASKKADSALEIGYRFDNSATIKCIATQVSCSPVGNELCTWQQGTVIHNLRRFVNNTSCPMPLYKAQ